MPARVVLPELLRSRDSTKAAIENVCDASFRAAPLDRIEVIKHGVAPQFVVNLAHAMEVSQNELSTVLGISKSTIARKLSHHETLGKHDSERVIGLAVLIGQLKVLIEDQAEWQEFSAVRTFYEWATQPVPALGGRKPSELLDTMVGQQVVSDLLSAIHAGTYM